MDRESSEEQQSWAQSIRVSSSVKLKAVATKRGREKERERGERGESQLLLNIDTRVKVT